MEMKPDGPFAADVQKMLENIAARENPEPQDPQPQQ
jgi:hypothetical protein